MVTTAGSGSDSVSSPPSTSRVTIARSPSSDELRGEGRLRPAEERGEHLAGLVGVVVDRLLAQDDEARRFPQRDGLQRLGDGERLDARLVGLDQDAAVGAHGEPGADGLGGRRRADRDDHHLGRPCRPPSAAAPLRAPISSNGFIAILTLARSTPLPSALTRTLTLKSTTRLTATRIFIPRGLLAFLYGRRPYGRRGRIVNRLAVEERCARPPHDQDEHGAADETADMRPPGDLALATADEDGHDLEDDPEAEHINALAGGAGCGRRPVPTSWRAGAGSGRRRRCRRWRPRRRSPAPVVAGIGEDEDVAGAGRAEQVEDEEADVAERILDVVGEHPEEDHVAGEVPEIGMEEGIGEQRRHVGHRRARSRRCR